MPRRCQSRARFSLDENGRVSEYPLRGGSVNTVVRAGDTVRRRPGGRFVHELLGFFERSGWGGAPRFLGVDERGREILSFVDGYVPWQAADMPGVTAEASLVRVAELVREFHDLTAGTAARRRRRARGAGRLRVGG